MYMADDRIPNTDPDAFSGRGEEGEGEGLEVDDRSRKVWVGENYDFI